MIADTEPPIARLPRSPTSFVGRNRELATIAGLLEKQDGGGARQVITLTGAPGVGETRLAIEAASQVISRGTFAEIRFVDLSGLAPEEADRVLALVAETLGVSAREDKALVDALVERLSRHRLLLVVDNFEQVVESATAVARLLERSPRTSALITSRRPLGVYGECEVAVAPLTAPPNEINTVERAAGYDTVQLFVQRAQARDAEFVLSDNNAAAVAEICRRLDGLPLAIELAAARVKLLPPRELLRRLADRLGLLTGGPRDLAARHRTMRAAIDWSYQLLTPDEQHVLRALAVFVGGFSLSAAQAVVTSASEEPMLDAIQALLDNGLIHVDHSEGEPRYRMLETVREYARERLAQSGEADAVRARHADYYVHTATRSGRASRVGPADEENLSHALESVLIDSLEDGRKAQDVQRMAIALDGLGRLAAGRGDLDTAQARFEQCANVFSEIGDERAAAFAVLHLGQSFTAAGRQTEARQFLGEAIRRFKGVGALDAAAVGLVDVGHLLLAGGDQTGAQAAFAEALHLARDAADAIALSAALDGAASLAAATDHPHTAVQLAGAAASLRAAAGVAARSRGVRAPLGLDAVRAALAQKEVATAWDTGSAMSAEQAVAYALDFDRPAPPPTRRDAPSTAGEASVLSRREREVAVLIARGHTNREIARALVISEWTVDTHVRHILTKLSLRFRAQVAVWAVERQLLIP